MRRTVLLGFILQSILSGTPVRAQPQATPPAPQKIVAVKAGRLVDPESGTVATNQVIVVEGERIREVGAGLAIPPGADVIDLSNLTVLPGLVDAHTHTALTYKEVPENNVYYLTYVLDSTPLRGQRRRKGRWPRTDARRRAARDRCRHPRDLSWAAAHA
jgi:imidazolonepropionase-like amidohydrolase